jgi:hypothetical protein
MTATTSPDNTLNGDREPHVLAEALKMLVETRFKDQPVRMVVQDADGGVRVGTVQGMLARNVEQQANS